MELVYSNDQLLMVNNVKNLLQSANIDSQLKNEFLAGGAGDLSPLDTWPELWVDEQDVDKAKAVIDNMNNDSSVVWSCGECKEENPAGFDICWQCQTVKEQ
jgi:hypothetical protein